MERLINDFGATCKSVDAVIKALTSSDVQNVKEQDEHFWKTFNVNIEALGAKCYEGHDREESEATIDRREGYHRMSRSQKGQTRRDYIDGGGNNERGNQTSLSS